MTVSLAPRITARRSAAELEALAEQGNEELRSLAADEATPAEVIAWVARHFAPEAAAVWAPYQKQATTARTRAGRFAPQTPNEARASTG